MLRIQTNRSRRPSQIVFFDKGKAATTVIRITDAEFIGNNQNCNHVGQVLGRVLRGCDSLIIPTDLIIHNDRRAQ